MTQRVRILIKEGGIHSPWNPPRATLHGPFGVESSRRSSCSLASLEHDAAAHCQPSWDDIVPVCHPWILGGIRNMHSRLDSPMRYHVPYATDCTTESLLWELSHDGTRNNPGHSYLHGLCHNRRTVHDVWYIWIRRSMPTPFPAKV